MNSTSSQAFDIQSPSVPTPDFAACKRAEQAYQENKYGKRLARTEKRFVLSDHYRRHFLPLHLGGTQSHGRGLLYSKALKRLPQKLRGVRVLDYCCGNGFLAVYLAALGADVSAVDVSENAIEAVRRRADSAGFKIDAQAMDCEHLRFPDSTFDVVIGLEALHHVIIYPRTPSELRRVLKPNGYAVFAENWGGENSLLQMFRQQTSLKRQRSDERGEVVLGADLLHARMGEEFELEVEAFNIAYLWKKYWHNRWFALALYGIDSVIEQLTPASVCGESTIVARPRAA